MFLFAACDAYIDNFIPFWLVLITVNDRFVEEFAAVGRLILTRIAEIDRYLDGLHKYTN
jgi:hypothetical protein